MKIPAERLETIADHLADEFRASLGRLLNLEDATEIFTDIIRGHWIILIQNEKMRVLPAEQVVIVPDVPPEEKLDCGH